MRLTFDPNADAAFLYLSTDIGPGGVAYTHICDLEIREGAVILAFDDEDRLIGVEVLGASKLILPGILQRAERL